MSEQAWSVVIVIGIVVAVASLVGAIILAVRVWRTHAMLSDLGAGGKLAFYGALVYTISPLDVLPDPIYLDDMGVLAGALLYLTHQIRKHHAARSAAVPRQAGPPAPQPVRRPQRKD